MVDVNDQISLSDDVYLEIISKITQATNVNELMLDLPKHLPIRSASYYHSPAVGAWDFKNLSQNYSYNIPQAIKDYQNKYDDHEAYVGIAALFSRGAYIWYSDMMELPEVRAAGHYKIGQIALSVLGEGLCLPLFGPKNRKGYMYMSFYPERDRFSALFPLQIHALAQLFHVRYCLILENLQTQVKLTPREAEVLEYICFGKSNVEIAKALGISPNTVTGYVQNIFLKLEVNDRVSAAMRAQTIKVDG